MKKSKLCFLLVGILAVGATSVSICSVLNKPGFGVSGTEINYNLNIFQAIKNSGSDSSVDALTSNGNKITISYSGVSVDGQKLKIAKGGYIEVARNDLLGGKNALSGLTQILTDGSGKIIYSYLDNAYTVSKKVSGNITFDGDYKPSFFKYEAEEETTLSSFEGVYSCIATTKSYIKGNKTISFDNGEFTSVDSSTTFTIPLEIKKGSISYKVKAQEVSNSFTGAVVGLDTDATSWWVPSDSVKTNYVMSTFSPTGYIDNAVVNEQSSWKWADSFCTRHLITNFDATKYTDVRFDFDVDRDFYTTYVGDQVVARHTLKDATDGSGLGFRFNTSGASVKDILIEYKDSLETGSGFLHTNGQYIVTETKEGPVYSTSTNSAVLIFENEIPSSGTILYDTYFSTTPTTAGWNEGLMFTDDIKTTALAKSNGCVFGRANGSFSAITTYSKGDGTYGTKWMTTRVSASGINAGTWYTIKIDYNLDAKTFALSKKAAGSTEFTSIGNYAETDANVSFANAKYIGFRASNVHNANPFELTFKNITVNGGKY